MITLLVLECPQNVNTQIQFDHWLFENTQKPHRTPHRTSCFNPCAAWRFGEDRFAGGGHLVRKDSEGGAESAQECCVWKKVHKNESTIISLKICACRYYWIGDGKSAKYRDLVWIWCSSRRRVRAASAVVPRLATYIVHRKLYCLCVCVLGSLSPALTNSSNTHVYTHAHAHVHAHEHLTSAGWLVREHLQILRRPWSRSRRKL